MSLKCLPRSVVALGLVSMFMDVSSEMIHSLLPIFLVSVLGVSALSVGAIEGVAEASRVFRRSLVGSRSCVTGVAINQDPTANVTRQGCADQSPSTAAQISLLPVRQAQPATNRKYIQVFVRTFFLPTPRGDLIVHSPLDGKNAGRCE